MVHIKAHNTKKSEHKESSGVIESYHFLSGKVRVDVEIKKENKDYVPIYITSIATISRNTEILLEKIRNELIKKVSFSAIDITESKDPNILEKIFTEEAIILIIRNFPDLDEDGRNFLAEYIVQKSLGFGSLHILLNDNQIEEIVINSAKEPVWIYHKRHGWLKTDIMMKDEHETKRLASMVGRKIGRQISVLEPMLDAHLENGSRVNATFSPISVNGNTMTFRKFSSEPMTITHFLEYGAITYDSAALVWHSIQYEMSILISGGTASGKTSMMNVLACFFPPNQRILSIEDTREIRLPIYLHWVPLVTRLPNAEGKGEVAMSDLLVNSLRMRPDRILVGEVRRKKEIETLFEAIHTGHSCYATIHANDCTETINRLVNAPFDVPITMLPAVSLVINQFRNRRTGVRRTFQIAEINKDGSITILKQYDTKTDKLKDVVKSKTLIESFKVFSGQSNNEIDKELKEKEEVLKYLVKNKIYSVDAVGKVIAEYYINKKGMMDLVKGNKMLEG